MDEDYEDFEDDEVVTVRILPGRQVTTLDFVITGLDSLESFIGGVKLLLCQRVNYRVQRRNFEDQARAEIEAITSGVELK